MPFKITTYEHGHVQADIFTEPVKLEGQSDPQGRGVRVYVAAGGFLSVEIITGLNDTMPLLKLDLNGYPGLEPEDIELMAEEE